MSSTHELESFILEKGYSHEKKDLVELIQIIDETKSKYGQDVKEWCDSYRNPVTALLSIATFAATITFTIIFTPHNNGQIPPGFTHILYANSLFCAAIMGCILIAIAIEGCITPIDRAVAEFQSIKTELEIGLLEDLGDSRVAALFSSYEERLHYDACYEYSLHKIELPPNFWQILIAFVTGVVGFLLIGAFYVLIYASHMVLQLDSPFILGSTLYLGFGFLAIILWVFSLVQDFRTDSTQKKNGKLEARLRGLKIITQLRQETGKRVGKATGHDQVSPVM